MVTTVTAWNLQKFQLVSTPEHMGRTPLLPKSFWFIDKKVFCFPFLNVTMLDILNLGLMNIIRFRKLLIDMPDFELNSNSFQLKHSQNTVLGGFYQRKTSQRLKLWVDLIKSSKFFFANTRQSKVMSIRLSKKLKLLNSANMVVGGFYQRKTSQRQICVLIW